MTARFSAPRFPLAAMLLAGCGAAAGPAPSNGGDTPTMSVAEAQQVLDDHRAPGAEATSPDAPTSLGDAYALVRQDRFPAFEAALRYAEEREGAEALALRAWVHLSRAGVYDLVSDVLRERTARMEAERRALERRDDEDAAARAEDLATSAEALRRVLAALGTLREDALDQGGELAAETLRRYPRAREGHVALASLHRQRGDWPAFDEAIRAAEAAGEPTATLRALRAFEALDRYRDRAAARALLDEALVLAPDLVRAKAVRVFLADDPADRYAALQDLRAAAPRHPVVLLAGPTLEAEHEAALEVAR